MTRLGTCACGQQLGNIGTMQGGYINSLYIPFHNNMLQETVSVPVFLITSGPISFVKRAGSWRSSLPIDYYGFAHYITSKKHAKVLWCLRHTGGHIS